MGGWVYVIRMSETDYYKVGVSLTDPVQRLKDLQIGNPVDLALVATSPQEQPYQIETELHAALDEHSVRGEWFKMSQEAILRVFRDYTTMALVDHLLDDADPTPYRALGDDEWADEVRRLAMLQSSTSRTGYALTIERIRDIVGRDQNTVSSLCREVRQKAGIKV